MIFANKMLTNQHKTCFFSGWTKGWIFAVLRRETQCFQGFALSLVNTNKHQKTLENPHPKRLEIDLFIKVDGFVSQRLY